MNDEAAPAEERSEERSLAWLLLHERNTLLARWACRVLEDASVPTASRLSWPALEDSMPPLIDRLSGRLARHPPSGWGESIGREVGASPDVGVAHAKHRSGLHYTVAETLRELSHFRAVLVEMCHEHHTVVDVEEAKLMHATIDEMMTTSASEIERGVLGTYEEIMAVVAHDLRNPISLVVMHASKMSAGQSVDTVSVGRALERSATRMQRLVEDLLAFTGLAAGHLSVSLSEIDARNAAYHVVEQLSHAAIRGNVELRCVAPEKEVRIVCDPERVEQALGNLVANAIKFTPRGGSVRVEVEGRADGAGFRVSDTGPGIDPQYASEILRPFWQAPGAPRQGVGLGLAITRGIVEAHGGSLTVESTPGAGATFAFTLPFDASGRGMDSFTLGGSAVSRPAAPEADPPDSWPRRRPNG